jgi:hypothetical protein
MARVLQPENCFFVCFLESFMGMKQLSINIIIIIMFSRHCAVFRLSFQVRLVNFFTRRTPGLLVDESEWIRGSEVFQSFPSHTG